MDTPERLLHPINDAVYMLGFGRSKVYQDIASGRLESIKVGSRRLIPHDALVAYVELLRDESPAP